MNCELCDEHLTELERANNQAPNMQAHRECILRSVAGGIGHQIAHEWWCEQKGDPDAGLTRRQSALLVDAYIRIMGVEAIKF